MGEIRVINTKDENLFGRFYHVKTYVLKNHGRSPNGTAILCNYIVRLGGNIFSEAISAAVILERPIS
jgi:hypothetical protein